MSQQRIPKLSFCGFCTECTACSSLAHAHAPAGEQKPQALNPVSPERATESSKCFIQGPAKVEAADEQGRGAGYQSRDPKPETLNPKPLAWRTKAPSREPREKTETPMRKFLSTP